MTDSDFLFDVDSFIEIAKASPSRQARHRHAESGALKTNRERVQASLSYTYGKTAAEVAAECRLNPVEVRRRIDDLRNDGEVYESGRRVCGIAGTIAKEWRLKRGHVRI